MRLTICILLAITTLAWGKQADAIDQLVAKLSATHGIWVNGLYQPIVLPKTARIEDVVSKAIGKEFPGYKILTQRDVHIKGPLPDLYTAVLVQTQVGQKIVLLQYQQPSSWWNRVYDVSPPPDEGSGR